MEAIFGFDWFAWLSQMSRHCTVCYTSDKPSKPHSNAVVIGYPTGFV